MYARWAGFAVGLGLVLAPLVAGYADVGAILRDVAIGTFVCVATLAALEWPRTRFLLTAPALWLLLAGRSAGDPRAGAVEATAGGALALLALFPSGRLVPRLPAQARRSADPSGAARARA
jgi:hypothetical protein